MNVLDQAHGANYALYHGDSVEVLPGLPSNSVHLSVFSPPFLSLYVYSASERDLGNSRTPQQFWRHFRFIIDELLRVTVPGRLVCVHVAQVATTLSIHGRIGFFDFRGLTIRAFERRGFIYHGEATIQKNPQALKNGTPVLTPFGWTPIESLQVGDLVVGSDGRPTRVIGVWPQGVRPLRRVRFSDDAEIVCDDRHLWAARSLGARASGNGFSVVPTEALRTGGLRTPAGRRRYEIPVVAPVEYPLAQRLPVDPYILGALLGDGNISQRSTVAITSQHDIVARTLLPAGHSWRLLPGSEKGKGAVATYNLHGSEWHQNDVLNGLRLLNLQGKRAWEKFIPESYLLASVHARRELLRGLLDTDGKIHAGGGIWFYTTSEQMAGDVIALVRSLGGIARRGVETRRAYVYRGEVRNGRPLYAVNVRLSGDWCPFTLPSKVARWSHARRTPHREIVSIEDAGDGAATCISVEAEDGLFVADSFVVTHNSQAIRTHAKGLLFVQLRKDSAWMRPALADYIIVFRAPGDNPTPVKPDITNEEWIDWAYPIWQIPTTPEDKALGDATGIFDAAPGTPLLWYGIEESDTLNVAAGRDPDDERHICPLQLGTIERCVRLWSNPGETVLTPFAGIGSEVYQAVKLGRKGIGIELKRRYYETAVANVTRAAASAGTLDLVHLLGE